MTTMGRSRGNNRAALTASAGTTLLVGTSVGRPRSAWQSANIGSAMSDHQVSATLSMQELKRESRKESASAAQAEHLWKESPPFLKRAVLSSRTPSTSWHTRAIQSKPLDVGRSLFAVAVFTILSPSSSSARKKCLAHDAPISAANGGDAGVRMPFGAGNVEGVLASFPAFVMAPQTTRRSRLMSSNLQDCDNTSWLPASNMRELRGVSVPRVASTTGENNLVPDTVVDATTPRSIVRSLGPAA
mmetsp:Transcript_10134/g.29498  ORF Transcript_10134/g.29498 Transcript_10134/m.29498 type:complete len:244 (-) Transcript_10134:92-823(-)